MPRWFVLVVLAALLASPAAAVRLVPVDLALGIAQAEDYRGNAVAGTTGPDSFTVPWAVQSFGPGGGPFTVRTVGNEFELLLLGTVTCGVPHACEVTFPEFTGAFSMHVPDLGDATTQIAFSYLEPVLSSNVQIFSGSTSFPDEPVSAVTFESYTSTILPGAPVALNAIFSERRGVERSHVIPFVAGDDVSISFFAGLAGSDGPRLGPISFAASGDVLISIRIAAHAIAVPEPALSLLVAVAFSFAAIRSRPSER
jgi:hypothetical protein